jgi:hypothetical protein
MMPNQTPAVPRLSWAEVCARRLERHALSSPRSDAEPADIVGAICGAHAQIMAAAELSIGLRLDGTTRADVRQALWEQHRLVKTFGPRGTVHLLPLHDLPLWTGALSAIPQTPSPFRQEAQLTPEQTEIVIAAIADVLEDAELTIDELTESIVAASGAWAGDLVMPAFGGMWPRWRQAIGEAANRGVLCFGPNRGRNVTYTNPRRWLPGFKPLDGPAALDEILKRYLHSYGPATPAQFAQWLAAPQRWAGELFASLASELQQVEVEGRSAWLLAGDTTMPSEPSHGLRLLPYFDAYVVGCHPRELLFPGRAAKRALAGGQAGNFPVLLIGGVVAGVWHLRRAGRKLAITVEPLKTITAGQRRALDDQVARVGAILEGTPELTIGTVTVGPHA